jgi:phage/plasmid-associated DNA primase
MAQHGDQRPPAPAPLAMGRGEPGSGTGSFALLPSDIISDRAVACLHERLSYKQYKARVPQQQQAKADYKAQYARDMAFLQHLSESVLERADGRGDLQGKGQGISMQVWGAICDGKVVHLNTQAPHSQALDADACRVLHVRFSIRAAIAPFEAGGLIIPSGEAPELLRKICAGLEEELEMCWLAQPHSQDLITGLTNRHQLYEGFPEAPYVQNIAERFLEDPPHLGRMVSGLRAACNEATEYKSGYRAAAESLVLRSKQPIREFTSLWLRPCTGLGSSVLQHYSRNSDPVQHEAIAWELSQALGRKQHFERTLRDYYLGLHRDRLLTVTGCKCLFIWKNHKWKADDGKILKHHLFEVVSKKFIALNTDADAEYEDRMAEYNARPAAQRKRGRSDSQGEDAEPEPEPEPKPVKPQVLRHSQADNSKLAALVLEHLRANALDIDPFDQNPDLFNFTNGVFNTRTLCFSAREQYDFCRMTSGRPWDHPSPEAMSKVEALVKQIFPRECIRLGYMSVLKSCLTGTRPENFTIANGAGRNGKGMLNELALLCAGEYGTVGHLDLITRPIRSGANPEAAELHRKRMVLFTEPEDGLSEPLRLSNIKKLTGDGTLNARLCYSNNTTTELNATIIMECNKQPLIAGDKGEAAQARVRLFPFETTFTADAEKLLDPLKYQPIDPSLKEKSFQEFLRCAFFLYLMIHGGVAASFPEETKTLGKKYLEDNDEFAMWFSDSYELDEQVPICHFISIKELYEKFKVSQIWDSMAPSAKSQMLLGRFSTLVQTNVMLKPFYRDRNFSVFDTKKDKMIQKGTAGVIQYRPRRYEDTDIADTPEGSFGRFTRLMQPASSSSSVSQPLPLGPPGVNPPGPSGNGLRESAIATGPRVNPEPAQLGAPQGQQRTEPEPAPSCTRVLPTEGNGSDSDSEDWGLLFYNK